MKVSVSLPEEDVQFLDTYAHERRYESRSAVVHQAVRLLRAAELPDAYESAWDEWVKTGESDAWESTADDGLAS